MGSMGAATRETNVGKGLLVVRHKAGMTQVDLAKKLGWRDGSRISRIEHGLVKPSTGVWKRISKILDAGASEMVSGSAAGKPSLPVRPESSRWRHDAGKKVIARKMNEITFTVPVDEIRDPKTFAEWVTCIASQSWASEEVVGGFVKAALRVNPALLKSS